MNIDTKEVNRLSEPHAARYAETGTPVNDGQRLADMLFKTATGLNAFRRQQAIDNCKEADCCDSANPCKKHLMEQIEKGEGQ